MTNKEYLFKEAYEDEVASYLIKQTIRQLEPDIFTTVYIAPDLSEWFVYDDAINATIEWLNKEVQFGDT